MPTIPRMTGSTPAGPVKRLIAATAIAAALAIGTAAGAGAAPPQEKMQSKTANPATACAMVTAYTGDSYSSCVRGLATGSDGFFQAALTIGCVELEGFGLTWPYTFYAQDEMPPGWPKFTAHNRTQCAYALYAYHNLAPHFFGDEE
jgi:hypothetical protein